jgi:hypothetical protein
MHAFSCGLEYIGENIMVDAASLVDVRNGTQAKSIFWDETNL